MRYTQFISFLFLVAIAGFTQALYTVNENQNAVVEIQLQNTLAVAVTARYFKSIINPQPNCTLHGLWKELGATRKVDCKANLDGGYISLVKTYLI